MTSKISFNVGDTTSWGVQTVVQFCDVCVFSQPFSYLYFSSWHILLK